MNGLDAWYRDLLEQLLESGSRKQTRNGEVLSVFGRQFRHSMKDGFPLLTTKKMAWKQIVTELLWFLRGDTNIKYLVDNDCHIWDGDAYKNFLMNEIPHDHLETKDEFINKIKTDDKFAREWGELGPIYGRQWRRWKQFVPYDITEEGCKVATVFTDQVAELIEQLKTNPDSRRLMVSAWNVGELDQMVLPPCHYGFQCYVREGKYLSLMWNQRSVDTFLGLPFNIASYGLLLEILAREVGMVPDELIGNLGDVHLYSNHIEQAREQIKREPFGLPTLKHMTHLHEFTSWLFDETYGMLLRPKDFVLDNYQSHPQIKAPLSN